MTARNRNTIPSLSTLGLALAVSAASITGCDAMGDADPRELADVEATDTDTTGADGDGCTLTQGYWKNHQPWPIADAGLCEQTWDEILHTPPKGNAWYIVAHQWIAASLNVASGAAVTPEVQAALDAAEGFLADCEISKAEKADALAASSLLDDYNNGAVGPGHCDDGPGDTGDATTGDDTTTGDDATTGDDDTTTGDDTTTDGTTGPWPIPG